MSFCIKKENSEITLEQTNKYNGSGTRIQKKESVTEEGVSTETINNYFYSQGGVLYTEDGSGNGTNLNLQGISGNVIATAREEAGVESYYYYHKDPTGSTTNLRSADGTTVVSYQYTDFGETSIYGDTDFYNEICYNGAIYDESTGLYYLSARYYDPEDGRFLTRDGYRGTATNAMTWHLYAYCANNPINYDDPSGHISLSKIVKRIADIAVKSWHKTKKISKKNIKIMQKKVMSAGGGLPKNSIGLSIGAKLAKRVVSNTYKRLPSIKSSLQTMKSGLQKMKTGEEKTFSKTKQVISQGKKTTIGNQVKRGTLSIGMGFNANLIIGYSGAVVASWDRNGNFAVQISDTNFMKKEQNRTTSVGVADIGIGFQSQITNAHTIYELEGYTEYYGVSGGMLGYGGVDYVRGVNNDYNFSSNGIHGVQVQVGAGIGWDMHVTRSYTETIWEE